MCKINVLEQASKVKLVEIHGHMPYEKNEDVIKILASISTAIGIDFAGKKMIDHCYRHNAPRSSGILAVQLCDL